MLAGILGLVILVTRLWPETPFARALHRGLVEAPLAWAERLERKHIILVVVVVALCGAQTIALLGPELALVYAMDVSIYAEAVIATSLATAGARVRFVWHRLKAAGARVLRLGQARPRARRTRASGTPAGKASNDDDPALAGTALAA